VKIKSGHKDEEGERRRRRRRRKRRGRRNTADQSAFARVDLHFIRSKATAATIDKDEAIVHRPRRRGGGGESSEEKRGEKEVRAQGVREVSVFLRVEVNVSHRLGRRNCSLNTKRLSGDHLDA